MSTMLFPQTSKKDEGTYQHPKQSKHGLFAGVLRAQVAHVARAFARAREVHGECRLRAARDRAAQCARCAAQAERDDAEGRVCARGGHEERGARRERDGREVGRERVGDEREVVEDVGEEAVGLRFWVEGRAEAVPGHDRCGALNFRTEEIEVWL